MSRFGSQLRALGALLLVATVLLTAGANAGAQDTGTPVVQTSDHVTIACSFDASANESSCDFTLVDSDGLNPDAFVVYSSQLCASVARIGSANWTDGGNLTQSLANGSAVTLTFPGEVTASVGGGTFGLVQGGAVTDISGDSIACQTPATSSGNASSGNASNTGNASSGNASSAGNGSSGTPTVSDTITISFFDCTADPGAVSPDVNPDCTAAQNVSIGVSIDGSDGGTFTSNASGVATFDAADGSAVVVTEDQSTITAGYVPYGDGRAAFTAADGLTRTFVHLPDSIMGRTQVVSCTYPTSGESHTAFTVIEPGVVRAAADNCTYQANVPFTLSGGALGAGLDITTASDGSWRGYLLPGDYTVTAQDGTTATFTVYLQKVTAVVAIDYVAQPTGAFSVARWLCSTDQNAPTTIEIATTAPDDPTGCTAAGGDITIAEEGSGANPAAITLGADGKASVDLKPASYVLTDVTSGETASFEISAGETVYATIKGGATGGSSGNGGNGGNSSNGGNESNGNSSGNGNNGNSSGNGGNASDGNGAQSGGGDAENGGGVTSLPDTGVFQPQPGGSLPLAGAAGIVALLMFAAWTRRRHGVNR